MHLAPNLETKRPELRIAVVVNLWVYPILVVLVDGGVGLGNRNLSLI